MMNQHQAAIAAFERGNVQEALGLLHELLKEQETSELWNDWATVQSSCGEPAKAEVGFLRALEIDRENHQAKVNLGLLLISLGEQTRGIPLLEESLPLLPDEQKQLLRSALAAAKERVRAEKAEIGPQRVLVIHDVAPTANSTPQKDRPIPIVKALRKLGHRVTLIVRDDRHQERWEPALKNLDVRLFTGDQERLCFLGRDTKPSTWSCGQILENDKFELAILTQNFDRGLSVPEHYLDEIRRRSPETRIAIVADELQGEKALRRFEATREFRHYEIAENVKQREAEGFLRADLVIAPDKPTADLLLGRDGGVEVAVLEMGGRSKQLPAQLATIMELATQLAPKSAAHGPFSVNLVEAIYASLLQTTTGEQRVYARLDFYVQFAEQLLRQDKPLLAREQLRHIFGWLGDSLKYAPALAQPLGLLNRTYRALGDKTTADRCAEEARRCFTTDSNTGNPRPARVGNPAPFQLSLIVPTYNRLPILKKCMAALENQTLAANHFEVIVIDDGSTDGTEDFMRNYSRAFQLRYLRQPNSGTGAARRHGVRHATGEYLLLMNDDTICDPNLLEEHLRAQQMYSGYQWAVLGDFEYPAEARHRALTHFFRANSFMFPQVDMAQGCPYGYSHFITCNLSIRRDAIVEAGSFDSTYKLSEDTEMGIRLFEKGYGVIYHPAAHAWHDHLPYPAKSLIRRARVYGADYFYMFRNHPRVMREWAMPVRLKGMNEADASCIHAYLERNRRDVEAAVTALERWDSVEFEPILENPAETRHVLSLFQQAVPAIHWFYLYESMLETMVKELPLSQADFTQPFALSATQGS
jgi:GT2 family glycosyltransferase